jgi:hypothetical protein
LLIEYIAGHDAQMRKYAEGDMLAEGMSQDAPPTSAGGGMPTGPGAEGPGNEAAMMASLGGAPGAEMGGAMGGEGGEGGNEAEIAQLLQVLEQMGVSPEELEQAAAQEGGAGGMPGGEGPAHEMAEAPMQEAAEKAAQAAYFATLNKYAGDRAATKAGSLAKMSNYVSEVIKRSQKR